MEYGSTKYLVQNIYSNVKSYERNTISKTWVVHKDKN